MLSKINKIDLVPVYIKIDLVPVDQVEYYTFGNICHGKDNAKTRDPVIWRQFSMDITYFCKLCEQGH